MGNNGLHVSCLVPACNALPNTDYMDQMLPDIC